MQKGDPSSTRQRGFWTRWYRLTSPPEVPSNASLEKREIVRRGRLASIIYLILYLFSLPSLPPVLFGFGPNKLVQPLFLFIILIIIIATYLNRIGSVTAGGFVLITAFSAIGMIDILANPGGLSLGQTALFGLFLIPEILSAAIMPAFYVFIFAIINSAFFFVAVTYLHHATGLSTSDAYLYGFFFNVTMQGIIAGVAFLWSYSMQKALKERDQAEEIARLERDLSDKTMLMAQQTRLLEQSILLINQTQAQVANGDLSARVPLTRENVLWSVAGTLNNLISRLQRSRAIEQKYEQTERGIIQLMAVLHAYESGQPTAEYTHTGTIADLLAVDLLPPSPKNPSLSRKSRLIPGRSGPLSRPLSGPL
jgi:hypothetical protein